MRTAAFGLAGMGVALLGVSLSTGHPLMRAAGLATVLLGALLFAADVALRRMLLRAGQQARKVDALRGALAAGNARAQLALEAIRERGLHGSATILSVGDAVGSFNTRAELDLELEIRVDGREPYRVRQRHLVPAVHVGRLRTGEVLRVRVDPEQQERLLIDWAAA